MQSPRATQEIEQFDPDCLLLSLIVSPERVSGALTFVLNDNPDKVIEIPVGHTLHVEKDTGRLGGDLWCPDYIDLLVTNSQSLEGMKMLLRGLLLFSPMLLGRNVQANWVTVLILVFAGRGSPSPTCPSEGSSRLC